MKMFLMMILTISSAFATDLVVHEWGTFTSMMGSNGKLVDGLHHEEDPLPKFVQGLPNCVPDENRKCMSRPYRDWLSTIKDIPHGVTQKMETPVIYFYSPQELEVEVTANFPRGIISQWFPRPIDYSPKVYDGIGLKNGKMNWKVKVSAEKLVVPNTSPESIWNPAREVNSNYLSSQGENEKFIFYRGVANFNIPVEIQFKGPYPSLRNESRPENIPFVMALNFIPGDGVNESMGTFFPLSQTGNIDPRTGNLYSHMRPVEEYLGNVSTILKDELVKTGLFEDEALAMVNTWKKSYFLTPGPRIIYIMPREWVDKILPLEINPVPKNLVRTFVGRIELRTREMDMDLLNKIKANEVEEILNDRLGEAKLRSLYRQLQTEEDRDLVQNLVNKFN